MKFRTTLGLVAALAAACGGGGGSNRTVSSGLKIFMTDEEHSTNFAGDMTLSGADGVAKADDFCNRSSLKPDGGTYKALLVDGTIRDAVTQTNWVLKPNTTYYRVYDDVVIGTTTAGAIFNVTTSDLQNSIGDCDTNAVCNYNSHPESFTGISDPADFSSNDEDCDAWSGTSGVARLGYWNDTGSSAFTTGSTFCGPNGITAHVYCVEQ